VINPKFVAGILSLSIITSPVLGAEKTYDPGATDSTIKIGNTAPYSGPGSAYSSIARIEAAYFKFINDQGGVNGRKIEFVTYDDAFSPPKAVEQTRKLVESDEVLFTISALGNPGLSVQKYMSIKGVPQLFISTGAAKAGMPDTYKWTVGWTPSYALESAIYVKHILTTAPDAKIGVLYQNDDFGKAFLDHIKAGLGQKASMIVSEMPYTPTDPTVDPLVANIKAAGADTFISLTTPKAAGQALKKVTELGWKPRYYQASVANSIGSVLRPVGLEHAVGMFSAGVYKDYSDPKSSDDEGMKRFVAFMDKYLPDADKADGNYVAGYTVAQATIEVIKAAGNELTRANVLEKARSLKDVSLGMLLPGITLNTTHQNHFPFGKMRMMRFSGETWQTISGPVDGTAPIE
jgi:branched-chain amino acid transport system substrate-binding protein